MKENKNIERLFQEKFKDFEVSPPDFVWENIQEKLNPKENKRRIIPFWFKTAGIAASFVAIVSVVFYNSNNNFKNTNTNNNNTTVVTSETNKENNSSNQNVGNNTFNSSNSNKNQNKSNASFTNETGSNSKSSSLVNNTNNVSSTNSVSNSKLNRGSLQNSNNSNNNFVSNHKKQSNQNTSKKNKTLGNKFNSGIAATQNNKNKSTHNRLKLNAENSGIANFNSSKNSNSGLTNINTINKGNATRNNKTNSSLIDVDAITKFNTSKNNDANSGLTDVNAINKSNTSKDINANSGLIDIDAVNNLNSSKNNKTNSSLTDVNNANSSNTTSKDSNGVLVENGTENSTTIATIEEVKIDTITLATVTIEENPLEKLLREKETKKVVDEKEKWSKWAVNSYVSPVFFNSFENGSPVSDEFASNEKTFNNSTSYGVGLAYNLNKRFSVKTGVSNLKLDYDTENIAFYSSFEDQSRIANTNIERNTNGKYLVLKNEKDVSKNVIENQILQSSQNLGTLNQKTQYIEVPLELSYAILNKKFGVAIKGGMSTLFLTENVISIDSNDGNMQIGKASNLNNVHFSSNLGLGLSYNFMKNFQLNLEPTLKYQINTFNKNSEDFSPYVIGVNTGISYKF